MFGLAIIFFFLLYLVIWILLVIGAAYFGLKAFKSKKAMFILGMIGFFIGYWPAFGDLIPTLWAHKQLCEKKAGFKVYVTPDEWDKENSGLLINLQPYEKYIVKDGVAMGNDRLGSLYSVTPIDGVAVKKKLGTILDVKNKTTLLQYVDFSRGYGNLEIGDDNRAIKFWLSSDSCFTDDEKFKFNEKKIEIYKKFKMEK